MKPRSEHIDPPVGSGLEVLDKFAVAPSLQRSTLKSYALNHQIDIQLWLVTQPDPGQVAGYLAGYWGGHGVCAPLAIRSLKTRPRWVRI